LCIHRNYFHFPAEPTFLYLCIRLKNNHIYLLAGLLFVLLFTALFVPGFKRAIWEVSDKTAVSTGTVESQAIPYAPDEYFRYTIGEFSGDFARIAAQIAMRNKVAPLDSLALGSKLAAENGFMGLSGFYKFWKARRTDQAEDYYVAAVDFIRAASSGHGEDNPQAKATEWTMAEACTDSTIRRDPKHIPARNARAVILSEFRNEPMQAVGVLRENEKLDSTNVETHYIYLSMLKKAGELEKAIRRCEKLISLQPQNPDFLYEMSGLYGMRGDSLNARIFLDLAVKVQRNAVEGKQK